jgi:mRNA interferase MazF
MTRYKIVLVRFPFDDLSSTKVRPALCLTEALGARGHVIVAFITSQIPSDLDATDFVIDDKHLDFTQTGLRMTSVVRLQRVLSVPEDLILRELGTLPEAMQLQVRAKLSAMLL